MSRIRLSAPWDTYYHEVNELFKKDDETKVVFDEEQICIKLYVKSSEKATAIRELMPTDVKFGNVTLTITVIPANGFTMEKIANKFKTAFFNNPIISHIETVEGIFTNPMTYVVFVKEVVQYFNDDLGDINGLCSTLYQDIAKHIFGDVDGVFFCTDRSYCIPF